MTRIVWGDLQDRKYEYGVDRGVLYPIGHDGVPWNGLVSVEETVVGGESTPFHYDGTKYLDIIANEDFQANLTAISAPAEFASCEGVRILAAGLYVSQQPRSTFGLCYRTQIGNFPNPRLGYKLHLVYNCTASPSGRTYSTKSDTIDPGSRTWLIDAVPPPNPLDTDFPVETPHDSVFYKPTAHFEIDSTKTGHNVLLDRPKIEILEDILYGTESEESRLPTPAELILILNGGGGL